MPVAVLIPKLGMTMTEGTVAEWRVPDGGAVQPGQVIYKLETEKIQFEVEAETAGTVRQLVAEGTTLAPGAVVAYVLAPGESLPAGVVAPAAIAATAPAARTNGSVTATVVLEGGRVPSSPLARRLAAAAGLDLRTIAGTGPGGRITESDVLAARARPVPAPAPPPVQPVPVGVGAVAVSSGEILASPLARRLAAQLGLDLARVRGTGPGGRITREDVEQAAAGGGVAAIGAGGTVAAAGRPQVPVTPPTTPLSPRPAPASPGSSVPQPGDVIPMRSMRKVLAERMHASLRDMAQLTLGIEVVMNEAVKLRTQLVEEWTPEGVRPSYTDLVIKAVGKALARHPLLNARVTDAGIELLREIHIGMAVALDAGLVVPVIRDAGARPLKEIALESTRLADAARAGTLTLDEMAGGTFSVTALGMYGVDFFTPIINPPNVAILGVGRIHDGTAWDGDRPVRRRQMTLSLTIDHRAVDGAPAAAFLGTVRDLLEAPYRLLV